MTDPERVLEAKRRKANDLDTENGEVFEQLQQGIRGFTMDATGPRLNLLIEALKKADVLTEEQWLDFEIEFHESVKEAMAQPLAQLQDARRQKGLTVVKDQRKSGGLLGPGGRPIKSGN